MFHQKQKTSIKLDELQDLAKHLQVSDVRFLNGSDRQFTDKR